MVALVHSCTKVSFKELHGHKLISTNLETYVVANKILCVRACTKHPMCASVNYKELNDALECELNSEATGMRDRLIEDTGSTFSCE